MGRGPVCEFASVYQSQQLSFDSTLVLVETIFRNTETKNKNSHRSTLFRNDVK